MAAICPHCGATAWGPVCPACHEKVPQETLQGKLRRLQSLKPAFAAGDLATLNPVLSDPELLEYSLLVATEVAPVRTIEHLLERGARVDVSLTDFENPLVAAVDRGDLEVLRVLLSAKKWENYAGSALRRAVDGNNLAMFNALLGAKSWSYDGEDAFSAACSQYKLGFAKALLDAGAQVNSKSQYTHATPLIWACQQHAQPTNDQTAQAVLELARLLIRHGADVNAVDADGHTAVWWAVARNHVDLIKLLMDAGADVNLAAKSGVSPLMVARRDGNRAAEQLLLAAGATAFLVEEKDKERFRSYWRHRAEHWWSTEGMRMSSVVCDYCNRPMERGAGFLLRRKLACAPCVTSRLLGPENFAALRNNPSHYGEGELQAARDFAAKRGI